jgi:hypothetical protein
LYQVNGDERGRIRIKEPGMKRRAFAMIGAG